MRIEFIAALVVAGTLSAQSPEPKAESPDTALIAAGKQIFEGRSAGGMCFTCHGPTAKGVPGLAPDLTDAKWLHGDGSLAFIESLVKSGVPKPKQAAAPMQPMGGSRFNPEQVKAVAAYVYSLSHPAK